MQDLATISYLERHYMSNQIMSKKLSHKVEYIKAYMSHLAIFPPCVEIPIEGTPSVYLLFVLANKNQRL